MKQHDSAKPLFLNGTEARARRRGFRFHDLVKLVCRGRVRAKPDPDTGRLTFAADDLDRLGTPSAEIPVEPS